MNAPLQSRPTVLVFCRAYLVDDFRANVAPLSAAFDFRFLCDGHKPGTDDTRAAFYSRLGSRERFSLLDENERIDVLTRCRLLRNLPRSRADTLLDAMGLALTEWFDRIRPAAVLCHMVDEYVTHLLSYIAEKRGATFVGYAGSFFPKRIQLTRFANGRAFDVREPDADEITETISALTRAGFRQNYNQKSAYTLPRHLFLMARYQVKRSAFRLKGLIERDPANVHYLITPYVVERRSLSDFPGADVFDADWAESAARSGRKVVYLPLGYFPESTIDYWIADRKILDYLEVTLRIAEVLGRRFTVLVKEHPHMLGARPRSFYRRLRTIPGVSSVPPLEFSASVLDASDAAVLGAGSGGVEAALRGKPIFSFCDTSYWFNASGATFVDLANIDAWPERIDTGLATFSPLDAAAQRAMIATCLRSTIRPRPGGIRWPLCDIDDLRICITAAVAGDGRLVYTSTRPHCNMEPAGK